MGLGGKGGSGGNGGGEAGQKWIFITHCTFCRIDYSWS